MTQEFINTLKQKRKKWSKLSIKVAKATVKEDKASTEYFKHAHQCDHKYPDGTGACTPVFYLSQCEICGDMG